MWLIAVDPHRGGSISLRPSIGLDADATVAKLIAALPSHEQKMVVGGNAAEVFRLGR